MLYKILLFFPFFSGILILDSFSQNATIESKSKEIIFNDLIIINALYNYSLIDTNYLMIIEYPNKERIEKEINYNSIIQNADSCVKIVKLRVYENFIFINAKFIGLIRPNCFVNFQDFEFCYLLYFDESKDFLYRIDGFITSDLLLVEDLNYNHMKKLAKVEKNNKYVKIEKLMRRYRHQKISNYLHSSVLDYFINQFPDAGINSRSILSNYTIGHCNDVD